MPAIVTTSASTNTNNLIPHAAIAAIQGDLANHQNLTSFKNILNQLLLIGNNDPNKSLEIINNLVNYIKLGFLEHIFNYFSETIDSRTSRLDNNSKKLFLELCAQFLLAYDELANPNHPNYASLNNYSGTLNNYFIFLDHLFAIPKIINLSLEKPNHIVGLIHHSEKLLEDLIVCSANTTSNEASVKHFFNTLANVAFDLGLNAHSTNLTVSATAHYVPGIEKMAGSFYTHVKGKVNDSLLTDAIGKYSLKLKDRDEKEAKQYCLDLFAQACLEGLPVVTTVQNRINTVATLNGTVSPSTDLLLTEAMLTQSVVEPTTLTSSSVQANVTLSPNNSTRNATEVDTTWNNTSNYLMPSIPELMAAAGHGIGNGVINAMSQQLAEYLNRAGYSGSQLSARALNLATLLAHSAYAASLPLILAALQNPDETDENAKDEMWQKVIAEVIPTFMTGLVFSLGFQGLNYFNRGYLSRFPTVKAVVQTIPVVSTAYAAISAPISTAVNIGAAATSSVLTKSAFHFFAPTTKKKTCVSIKTKEKGTEMEPLTMSDNLPKQVGEGLRKHKYITEENLRTLRNNSETLKTALESLVTCLEKSIKGDEEKQGEIPDKEIIHYYDRKIKNKNDVLSSLRNPLEMTKQLHELLMDEKHEDAYKIYDNEQEFKEKMGTTGSLFKRMEGYYLKDTRTGGDSGNLSIILHEIKGHLDAKKEIFQEEISIHLNTTLEALTTLLSPLSIHINQYNSCEAGLKGEERGRELLNSNGATTILRKKSNEDNTANNRPRRHTVTLYSSASNGSDDSNPSTLSASSERDPIEEQQERPLLLRA